MTSRNHIASACTGKTAYPSPQAAFDAMRIACDVTLDVYKCPRGHWHFGNTDKEPGSRCNPKQWKNWHWRKAAAEVEARP